MGRRPKIQSQKDESLKIKNYTSAVPVERTIASIEAELVKIGVTHIEKSYFNGNPVGVIFSINIPQKINFRIPTQIDAVYDIIKSIPAYRNKNDAWLQAQSHRTAWKIVYCWIQSQVTMIQLKQADAMQLFFPHVYDEKKGKTFYEKISEKGFQILLTEKTGE